MSDETDSARLLVVGVGASAGGLEAFQEFLTGLGDSPGFAVVFAQHLDPNSQSLLTELLAKYTSMKVVELSGRTPVRGNRVYVCPPQRLIELRGESLIVVDEEAEGRQPTSIDHFFHSLAEVRGEFSVGVILSGAGSDGTLGLKSISDCGGLTFAQDAASAKYDSMPRNAATTGVADHVLPPAEIARELLSYHEYLRNASGQPKQSQRMASIELAIPEIAERLLQETNHNFQHYKTSTLGRRIQRRMQVLKMATIEEYVQRIQHDTEETHNLFRELLIGVTAFFRDPESFNRLATEVLPKLFENRQADDPVRIWIPGCATGEEAYTIAILCREHLETIQTQTNVDSPTFQIFATDIDERALVTARQGVYAIGIAEHLTPERLSRHFIKKGKRYHVTKEIRESILFSPHNLISDPPFSRQDLISCRNLLIYLGSHLQKKLIPLFHYALRPGGYLMLGPSESISSHGELFRTVDARHRINQRKATAIARNAPLSLRTSTGNLARVPGSSPLDDDKTDILQVMQRIVLDEFAPKSVVIDEDGQVICSSGETNKYLSTGEGAFQNNIIKMARRGLRIGLRAAIAEAKAKRRRVTHENVSVPVAEGKQRVMLTVQPMMGLGEGSGLFLVVFHDVGLPLSLKDGELTTEEQLIARSTIDRQADEMIEHLERELSTTCDDLEKTMQEMEAACEEMKSSNEELLSMNEELQSANEELETSKEEIRASSDAIARANTDLENLVRSTRIATIFLDNDLSIRSFTPATKEIYGLIPTDIGRPLMQFVPSVRDMPELPSPSMLDQDHPTEHTVFAHKGTVYIRRVLPYRDQHGQTDGMVVTFTDVTEIKRAALTLADREAHLRRVINNQLGLVGLIDRDGILLEVDDRSIAIAGLSREQVIGKHFAECAWWTYDETVAERMRATMERAFNGETVRYDVPLYGGGLGGPDQRLMIDFKMAPVFDDDGKVEFLIPSGVDISDRFAAEQALKESENRFRAMADGLPLLVWVHDRDGKQLAANQAFCDFYDVKEEEMREMEWHTLAHPDDFKAYTDEFARCVSEQCPFHAEVRVKRADGQWRWLESWGQPHCSKMNEYLGHIGASADITDRKQSEFQLQFISELQAALDPLSSAAEIAAVTTTKVFEWINPMRCNLIEFSPDGKLAELFHQKIRPGLASSIGNYTVDEFAGQSEQAQLRTDRPLAICNIHDGTLSRSRAESHAAFGTAAFLVVPYVSEGALRFALTVDSDQPRDWQTHEITLLSEVTERLYLRLQRAWAEEQLVDLAAQLRDAHERLRFANSAAKTGMFDWNIEQDTVAWDDQHLQLTGLHDVPHLGQTFLSRIHADDVAANDAAIERAISSGGDYNIEFRFQRPDGQLRWLAARGLVVTRADGCRHFIGLNWDITESKQMEQSLLEARELAIAANASKSEFLANMSHEIRTPMTAILGYAEILRDTTFRDEAKEHLETIRRNGRYLLEIIDDILDIS